MSKSKQSPLSSPLGSAEESIESVPMKVLETALKTSRVTHDVNS